MNQILDYNPSKNTGKGSSSGSDKVVRVFAIILALFAIALLGIGGFTLLKNRETINDEPVATDTKPVITLSDKDEKTKHLKITHDKALFKIVYCWDHGKEYQITCNGETEIEEDISLIAGEHTLTIKVEDVDGVFETVDELCYSEIGEDKQNPTLKVEEADGVIKITATDETAMAFVTYMWNGGEEHKVEAEEDQKEIYFEIPILEGDNHLTVVAVDKNNNTCEEPYSKSFTGVKPPSITGVVPETKDRLDITITSEKNIAEVSGEINGQPFKLDIQGDQTSLGFSLDDNYLTRGAYNTVKILVATEDGTRVERVWDDVVLGEISTEQTIGMQVNEKEEGSREVVINITSPEGTKEAYLNINNNGEICVTDIIRSVNGDYVPEELTAYGVESVLEDGNNVFVLRIIKPNGAEETITVEKEYVAQ